MSAEGAAMFEEYSWLAVNWMLVLVPLAVAIATGLSAKRPGRPLGLRVVLGTISIVFGLVSLVFGGLWLGLRSDWRAGVNNQLEWIEKHKPNVAILTTYAKWDYREYKYPGGIGYVFGVGACDDISKADMYLGESDEVVIPGGYQGPSDLANGVTTWRTTLERPTGDEHLVRSRKGSLYYVSFPASEGSGGKQLFWVTFRPAPPVAH